ncbi:MAG: carboxypeptidase M32, partial [Starkeya sp.]|nr:carboxypeptidase M32 [Starkeya sp.]
DLTLPAIGRGDFAPLVGWLRTHVHGLGSLLATDELLTRATGRPLDAGVFKAHLARRYLPA